MWCTMVDQEIKPRFGRILLELFQEVLCKFQVCLQNTSKLQKDLLAKDTPVFFVWGLLGVFASIFFENGYLSKVFQFEGRGVFLGLSITEMKPEKSQKPLGWLVPLAKGCWSPLGVWFWGISRDLRGICANRGLWQAVFKCTKACEQCWVRGRQGHCTPPMDGRPALACWLLEWLRLKVWLKCKGLRKEDGSEWPLYIFKTLLTNAMESCVEGMETVRRKRCLTNFWGSRSKVLHLDHWNP